MRLLIATPRKRPIETVKKGTTIAKMKLLPSAFQKISSPNSLAKFRKPT